MLTTNDKFKCDECGEFISGDDLLSGKAVHELITPSSDLSEETYETLCVNHYGCQCSVCKRHKQYLKTINILNTFPLHQEGIEKVKVFLEQCYSDLNNVEMDNNVNRAIIDGTWPTAD